MPGFPGLFIVDLSSAPTLDEMHALGPGDLGSGCRRARAIDDVVEGRDLNGARGIDVQYEHGSNTHGELRDALEPVLVFAPVVGEDERLDPRSNGWEVAP